MKISPLLRKPSNGVIVLISLGLIAVTAIWHAPFSLPSEHEMRQWTLTMVEKVQLNDGESHPIINTLLLFSFLALATSCGLPRQIAALVAGINLGALMGAIIATLAATLGCLITFSVSRYIFKDTITKKYPDKIAVLSDFISERTFIKTVVIRLLPIGSNFLTNIVAGVCKVSIKSFVGGSFTGFIPQMVIFSLAGSGIRLGAKNELIASAALFGIALILTTYLVKTRQRKPKPAK